MSLFAFSSLHQVVNTFRRYGRTFLIMVVFAGLFVAVMWYFEVSGMNLVLLNCGGVMTTRFPVSPPPPPGSDVIVIRRRYVACSRACLSFLIPLGLQPRESKTRRALGFISGVWVVVNASCLHPLQSCVYTSSEVVRETLGYASICGVCGSLVRRDCTNVETVGSIAQHTASKMTQLAK